MKTTYEETQSTDGRGKATTTYGRGGDRREFAVGGRVTEAIETQTGKLPWVSWLGLSVVSLAASAAIAAVRKKEGDYASIVGLWAPCFMLMGVYGKLMQLERQMSSEHAAMPAPNAEVPNPSPYLS